MNLIERVHESCIISRRARVLCRHLNEAIPKNSSVLDVGCGDGFIPFLLSRERPDILVQGIDVLVRRKTYIVVDEFDGSRIPKPDGSIDVVMFLDVLHHCENPLGLLKEASRVGRKMILIKDHLLRGIFSRATLRFMDRVGNARHGVELPYNYWTQEKWLAAIEEIGGRLVMWNGKLGLYPWPARLIFERSLHFLAKVDLSWKDL